jgi:hypothetical protein
MRKKRFVRMFDDRPTGSLPVKLIAKLAADWICYKLIRKSPDQLKGWRGDISLASNKARWDRFANESAMKTLVVFLAAVAGTTATVHAQNAAPADAPDAATREWTKGNTRFTARFEKVIGNTAVFSKVVSDEKKSMKLGAALDSLSKEDQKWIREYVKVQQAQRVAAWKQARTRARQAQRMRRY